MASLFFNSISYFRKPVPFIYLRAIFFVSTFNLSKDPNKVFVVVVVVPH